MDMDNTPRQKGHPMKTLRSVIILLIASAGLALGHAAPADATTCCVKAKAEGKACDHACCVEAHKDKKLCEKCEKNPSCCDKAIAQGKDCAHKCCQDATKQKKVCDKCNPVVAQKK